MALLFRIICLILLAVVTKFIPCTMARQNLFGRLSAGSGAYELGPAKALFVIGAIASAYVAEALIVEFGRGAN